MSGALKETMVSWSRVEAVGMARDGQTLDVFSRWNLQDLQAGGIRDEEAEATSRFRS